MEDFLHHTKEFIDSISEFSFLRDSNWIKSTDAIYISFAAACVALLISVVHIFRHLKSYTMPQIQIYVVRILITCPLYALSSSLSLLLGPYGTYVECIRDVWEVFVIYSFLHLILEYCGGESDCIYMIENESRVQMPCPLCCMPPRARDARLMRFCKRGVLQFMFIKPVVTTIDITLLATGNYYNSIWMFIQMVVYNISYGWALYCLYVFYLSTKKVIRSFRPVAKFAAVKSIIFATYYQSLFLSLALSSPENASLWNDLLLSIEMVVFAVALTFAFPVKEFIGGIPDRRVFHNVKELLTIRDVYQDAYHNFMPAYRDYSLQNSHSETPATTHLNTHFSSSLGSVAALEMTERYRGPSKRNAFNNLLRGTRPIRAKLRNKSNLMYDLP
jgi:hypothetical protein